jgi:peroxiredoxin
MKKVTAIVFLLLGFLFSQAQEKPEGLFINSKAADFKATDQDGKEVNMKDLRKKGNVVVVFYRGYWCPYCSKYMKRLQDSLELIKEANAELVVITPEGDEGIDTTVSRTGASFPIIYDKDMKISRAYKVAYKVEEKTVNRYKNSNPPIDLLKINGQVKEAYLPVPAVYIVNTDGAVFFRYFEEDYKKRLAVTDILDALKGNKN